MGINVRLENESGTRIDAVSDKSNLLHALLPSPDDEAFVCLRFVELYGDTIFNNAQMGVLIKELEKVRIRAKTHEQNALLDGILRLAKRCASEMYLYVRFVGD